MSNVRELLRDGEVLVKFEKRDGTIREMRCTTNELLIPRDKVPHTTHLTVNSEQVRVFDLDKKEWRSFNMGSLLDYQRA